MSDCEHLFIFILVTKQRNVQQSSTIQGVKMNLVAKIFVFGTIQYLLWCKTNTCRKLVQTYAQVNRPHSKNEYNCHFQT